jgi:hypothetical protein
MGLAGAHISTSYAGSLGIIHIDGMPDIEAHRSWGGWQANVDDQLYRAPTLGRLARTIRDDLTHTRQPANHRRTAKAKAGHTTRRTGSGSGSGNRWERMNGILDKIATPPDGYSHPDIDDRVHAIEQTATRPPPNRYDRAHPQPPPPPDRD